MNEAHRWGIVQTSALILPVMPFRQHPVRPKPTAHQPSERACAETKQEVQGEQEEADERQIHQA
jgi:hypothetical protein